MHADDVGSGVGVNCCGSCSCALHLAAGSLVSELSLLFFVRITPDRHTLVRAHTHTHTHTHTHIAAHCSWSFQTQDVICREQTTVMLQHKETSLLVHQAGGLLGYIPEEKHFSLVIIMSLLTYCIIISLANYCTSLCTQEICRQLQFKKNDVSDVMLQIKTTDVLPCVLELGTGPIGDF